MITMPGPPPYGGASTLRCLSVVKSRRSTSRISTAPLSCAILRMLPPRTPWNIAGKSVTTSMRMEPAPPRDSDCRGAARRVKGNGPGRLLGENLGRLRGRLDLGLAHLREVGRDVEGAEALARGVVVLAVEAVLAADAHVGSADAPVLDPDPPDARHVLEREVAPLDQLVEGALENRERGRLGQVALVERRRLAVDRGRARLLDRRERVREVRQPADVRAHDQVVEADELAERVASLRDVALPPAPAVLGLER